MACVIDADGFFHSDRLRMLSRTARLYWPWFFLAANSYGRLELSYLKIVSRAFSEFDPVPSEAEIFDCLNAFQANFLLFPYDSNGQIWGQIVIPREFQHYLPRHKLAADKRSPEPPPQAYDSWIRKYHKAKGQAVHGFPERFLKYFGSIPESFRRAVAVAVAVGVAGAVAGAGADADAVATNSQSLTYKPKKQSPQKQILPRSTQKKKRKNSAERKEEKSSLEWAEAASIFDSEPNS
jgi:hypothetical protein